MILIRFAAYVAHEFEMAGEARHRRTRERGRNGRRLRATAYGHKPVMPERLRSQTKRQPASMRGAVVRIVAVAGVAAVAFMATSGALVNFASDLPDARALAAEPLAQDTLIFASDGTQLADLHPGGYQHYYEPLAQMGKLLPAATVAVEDANFYHEAGIDVQGIARAAWADYRSHHVVQGASTITQQLVKLRLLHDNSPTLSRKAKEAFLATQVDRTYSKNQILEMYLNTVFYGNDAYGTQAAAQIYFHVPTSKLDLAQASMLAGIPQNPTYNNPFANWTGAKARQAVVLAAMVRSHVVTQKEADAAYAEDISPPNHMFQPSNQVVFPAFVSYVTGILRQQFGDQATYGGGLRVYTTINPTLQGLAQKALQDDVAQNSWRRFSQGALVSLDPRNGAVLAMVGSVDPNANGGQYNFAVWPPRNPGSSMKIYTYTAAIASSKYTMVTPVLDSPVRIPQSDGTFWQPKNYDLGYHGTCLLERCMGNSLNVPAVKVELGVGVPSVVQTARAMGAPPWYCHQWDPVKGCVDWRNDDPLDFYGPSLTLGGYGETPLQMATGAAVLGAQGVYHAPMPITRVTGADGTEVYKANPGGDAKQAIDPKVAWIMESIMSNDHNRQMIFGPGSKLTLPGRTVGAKTGTTDDFRDGWTVGYTPTLATAVWVGNADWSPMVSGSDGVFVAAPAWNQFMQTALDTLGHGNDWFSQPAGLSQQYVGGDPAYFLPGTSASTPPPPLPYGIANAWAAPPPPPKNDGGGGGGNGNGNG